MEPAVAVQTTFPIITHAVTAWVRALFGIDAEALAISPAVSNAFDVPVEITEK